MKKKLNNAKKVEKIKSLEIKEEIEDDIETHTENVEDENSHSQGKKTTTLKHLYRVASQLPRYFELLFIGFDRERKYER